MYTFLQLAVLLIIAAPPLDIRWELEDAIDLRFEYTRDKEFVQECAKSGLEFRVRFKVQLCKERQIWFDDCSESTVFIQSLTYEPLSERYVLRSDRLGDDEKPLKQSLSLEQEASAAVLSLRNVSLDTLSDVSEEYANSKNGVISARVHSYCKGDYNLTLSRISEFLTFGVVDFGALDTGWVSFSLNQTDEKSS